MNTKARVRTDHASEDRLANPGMRDRAARVLHRIYPYLRRWPLRVLTLVVIPLALGFAKEGFVLNETLAGALRTYLPTILCYSVVYLSFLIVARGVHASRDRRLALGKTMSLCANTERLTDDDFRFKQVSPGDIECNDLGVVERPWFGTYLPRTAMEDTDANAPSDGQGAKEYREADIAAALRNGNGRGFLLLGSPRSGKTMTAYQVLKAMPGCTVVAPLLDALPDADRLAALRGRFVVVWLDDIAFLVEVNFRITTFLARIARATDKRYAVLATCRHGEEYDIATGSAGTDVSRFCEERLTRLRLVCLGSEERIALSRTTGRELDRCSVKSFPLPGDITMRGRDEAMRERFKRLDEQSKLALRAMKLLGAAEVPISIARLRVAVSILEGRSGDDVMPVIPEALYTEYFLLERPLDDRIVPHAGLLDRVVQYAHDLPADGEHWAELRRRFEQLGDVEALLHLSYRHRYRGDLREALLAVEAALRVAPDCAEAHYRRGYTLARLGRSQEALKANARALQLRPDWSEAHNNRCYILSRLEKFEDALAAVDKALALRDGYDDAHANRAIVLARLGRLDKAVAEFEIAKSLGPDNAYVYLNLGITLSRQGAFRPALDAYDRALQLRKDYPEAMLNQGITLARIGRREEALKAFDLAIKIRPDYPEAHQHRGETLGAMHQLPQAVEALSEAIRLNPRYATAHLNRGRTYTQWRKYAEALCDLCQAIELRPGWAEAYLQRGIAHACNGLDQAALSDFTRALDIAPNVSRALLAKARALCKIAKADRDPAGREQRLAQAADLLERAVALDPASRAMIKHMWYDCSLLADHPDLGPRVSHLVNDSQEATEGR